MHLHTNFCLSALEIWGPGRTYVEMTWPHPGVGSGRSPGGFSQVTADNELLLQTTSIWNGFFFFFFNVQHNCGGNWCIYYHFIPWYLLIHYIWVRLCNESLRGFSCVIWGKTHARLVLSIYHILELKSRDLLSLNAFWSSGLSFYKEAWAEE